MDVNGSPEFVLIWKTHDMPSGPPICALRARERPTFDNGFGGWPSPKASNGTGAGQRGTGGPNLQTVAQMAGWPTPMAGTPAQKGYNEAGNTDSSRRTAALAGWATPRREDSESTGAHTGGAAALSVVLVWSLCANRTPITQATP